MGHHRLGRLPRTLRWREVVGLLDAADTGSIAARTIEAADRRLLRLKDDPFLTYSFWLLARVAWASREATFFADLESLGVRIGPNDSALTAISRIGDRLREESDESPGSGIFGEIAALAAKRALTETVGQEGRSLFGSSADDLRDSFRRHSTREQFGDLAERFFSDLLSRSLRAFVDRELSNHVGSDAALRNVGQSAEFLESLDRHTRQTGRILRDFAGAWYSKHNWESRGEIGREETQRFVAHALSKLRSELKRGASRS